MTDESSARERAEKMRAELSAQRSAAARADDILARAQELADEVVAEARRRAERVVEELEVRCAAVRESLAEAEAALRAATDELGRLRAAVTADAVVAVPESEAVDEEGLDETRPLGWLFRHQA